MHEFGFRQFGLAPDAAYFWPTLTVVDGTIVRAMGRGEETITQAKRHTEAHLK